MDLVLIPRTAAALLLALLAVTAVPVLARILSDRGLVATLPGSLSLAAAVAIDAVNWPILAVALGLATGRVSGAVTALVVLVAGVAVCFLVQRTLRAPVLVWACARFPRSTIVVFALLALAAAKATDLAGLTPIFGAFLVGLAVPTRDEAGSWPRVMDASSWAGTKLVPVFFVVTGVTVFAKPFALVSWLAVPVVIALAMLGKVGGGYLGARLGGYSGAVGWRIGVLMNTRGLTELIALQAGYSAGILSAELYFVLVLMALVTTMLTGPLLGLLDRGEARQRRLAPATAGESS